LARNAVKSDDSERLQELKKKALKICYRKEENRNREIQWKKENEEWNKARNTTPETLEAAKEEHRQRLDEWDEDRKRWKKEDQQKKLAKERDERLRKEDEKVAQIRKKAVIHCANQSDESDVWVHPNEVSYLPWANNVRVRIQNDTGHTVSVDGHSADIRHSGARVKNLAPGCAVTLSRTATISCSYNYGVSNNIEYHYSAVRYDGGEIDNPTRHFILQRCGATQDYIPLWVLTAPAPPVPPK
jgi:hypothetical protein